jgi:acyl-CoA oxidase
MQKLVPGLRHPFKSMKETLAPTESIPVLSETTPELEKDRAYPPIERTPASFDPALMQNLLDGEYRETREKVKALVTSREFRYFEGTDVREYRRQVLAWTRLFAADGYGLIFMPKEVGGESNLPKFMAAFETLAFHDISLVIKAGVQFGLFAGSIQRLGTEYHHRKYLADAASTKLLGCFAMTEIGHGSNVQGLETTATYDPELDQFVINTPFHSAGKTYIGSAAEDGRLATVFAQLEVGGKRHGVHAFVVPIRDAAGVILPGVRIEDNGMKMGLNGVDNGKLWFDQVRIPRAEMLNRFADVGSDGKYFSRIESQGARFFTMIGTLVAGRISIAASANSVAKSALTITVRYAARRRQFGPSTGAKETLILDYPSHQERLFPLLANVYALDFALKHLVAKNEETQPGKSRPLETLAAGLKAYTSWNTTRTIQTCREACGGEGYMSVNRFAALKADTDVYATFEGDNTVLMQLVAKNLLSELKEGLSELRPQQLAVYFIDQKLSRVVRRNPLRTWNTGKRYLLRPEAQIALFRLREDSLLLRAASHFRREIKSERGDAYAAFTKLQPELLELAHAHVERVILERFVHALGDLTDSSLYPVLKRLCDLLALGHLHQARGWYLENGAMSGPQAKALRGLVSQLCIDLRKDAVALVDAFGIPDACLAAPIAT